jgi:class 3 adenylate cyclase
MELGQRQLAAIVFTDVAGFSLKASGDEERVLRRVKDDLELLTSLAGIYHGNVVKTTGDGLLVSFTSAVDAVSFAIEGQRRVGVRNESLPLEDRFEHRMGIHLGDIFISESDAMGDGVNIAARLQAEAEPGGICISQTVYDVVKNKLSIRAVSLGPRELKNIREAIYAYRVVVDAQNTLAGKATRHPQTRRFLCLFLTGAAIALIAAALLVSVRAIRWHRATAQTAPAPAAQTGIPGRPILNVIRKKMEIHGRENPLQMRLPRRLSDGFGPTRKALVWMEGDLLAIKSGDDLIHRRLTYLPPRMIAALGVALERESRAAGMPTPTATP